MREETAPFDEVIAGFRGARLYAHGADGIAYLAERAGVPYLLVRPRPAEPEAIVLAFDDELERASYLAGRSGVDRAARTPTPESEDAEDPDPAVVPQARTALASPPLPVRGA
ncbi:hypothetical protein [Actinomadura roseirufa]|uniref:hypothetical protein n=1 Tax=Actinomadura roseirufa TaxID=2094049 RepID=UPI001041637E|nr:hypothetical protein [Actinomadura roseirufa]